MILVERPSRNRHGRRYESIGRPVGTKSCCGFHDDRQVYLSIKFPLEFILQSDDDEKTKEWWDYAQSAIPQALDMLAVLETISRDALASAKLPVG